MDKSSKKQINVRINNKTLFELDQADILEEDTASH